MSAARSSRAHDGLRLLDAYDVFDAAVIEAGECPACARPSTLVAPTCTEGHGDACPDRLCVDCGSALFVGTALPMTARLAQTA